MTHADGDVEGASDVEASRRKPDAGPTGAGKVTRGQKVSGQKVSEGEPSGEQASGEQPSGKKVSGRGSSGENAPGKTASGKKAPGKNDTGKTRKKAAKKKAAEKDAAKKRAAEKDAARKKAAKKDRAGKHAGKKAARRESGDATRTAAGKPATTVIPAAARASRGGVAAHPRAGPARARRAARPHAIVYVRAPDGQKDSLTAAEVDRARHLAAQRGWLVADAHVVVDTATTDAADGRLPGWTRVQRLVDTGAADIIVGIGLDRFVHSLSDLVQAANAGARVVLADGSIDLTAADADTQVRILGAIDAFQTERRGELHRRAIRERVAAGRPEVSGRRAFGFAQDGVTMVDAEVDVVRRIYRDFVGGASVYGIAAALSAEGVPVGTGRGWNRTRVRATLRSPIYRGAVVHHGRAVDSDAVPAVVDDRTWRAAQEILDDPSRRVTPGPARQHLLSGVLACSVDGCPGRAAYAQGRYRCAMSPRHPTVRADVAEALARRAVVRTVITAGADLSARADIDPYAADTVQRLYTGATAAAASDGDDIVRVSQTLFDAESVGRQRDVVHALLSLRIVRAPHGNTISVTRRTAARR